MVEIKIAGSPEEIAALVLGVQERQPRFVPVDSEGIRTSGSDSSTDPSQANLA